MPTNFRLGCTFDSFMISLLVRTYYFQCNRIQYILTGNGSFNRSASWSITRRSIGDDGRFVTGHGGVRFRHESARRCFLTQALRFEKFRVKNTDRDIEKNRVIAVTCKKLSTCFIFFSRQFFPRFSPSNKHIQWQRHWRYWCLHKGKGPPGGEVVVKTNRIPRTPLEYNFCTVFDLFLLLNFLFRSRSGAFPSHPGGCMHYKSRLFSNKMIHTGSV